MSQIHSCLIVVGCCVCSFPDTVSLVVVVDGIGYRQSHGTASCSSRMNFRLLSQMTEGKVFVGITVEDSVCVLWCHL